MIRFYCTFNTLRKMSLAVGIDLGTTNSCVAVCRKGKVKIIETEERQRIIPSFVYYTDEETIVGKEAVTLSSLNPQNGIFDVKRIIGLKFNNRQLQENLPLWPFRVTQNNSGEPLINVNRNDQDFQICPEEVSAAVLSELKKAASTALKTEIKNAVITVPAHFTNPQRQATKDAARIAGLNVLKLINEPTAAALAFSQNFPKNDFKERLVLVYDLGGGTFDVSVLKMRKDSGEVICVGGDCHLGGRDFDNNLVNHFVREINSKYKISIDDLKEHHKRRAVRRLRHSCEDVKKSLSETNIANLSIDEFFGKDVELEISRANFDDINLELYQKTIEIVPETLHEGGLDKTKIDDVLLVGGSTRIRKIREMVRNFFGKELNKTVNPDEAVAAGAAIQAASLTENPLLKLVNYSLVDVIPLPLGIKVRAPNTMSVILEKNSKVEVGEERLYRTISDNQTKISVEVYEGESEDVGGNIFLGQFLIDGITPKPKGEVKVSVLLSVDHNGILTVTAKETSKNICKDLKIQLFNGRLSEELIRKMIAKRLAEEAKISKLQGNQRLVV